ncbi:phosphoenolpyruvate--protein phosphotransferase [Chitinophaga costaii]|uniref:Phosphoenolpyruvate-protein phosphotransferase n=1 Tax=Chitinophaga costaii TaxID=1335309 RepID=A0A1C4CL91_9BACT|nr:phosphoenolpyruvate--protein phosphotransferase [Chitinophaga costaii]PUZ27044.1 phosphoenolpyruvate--protein phosphotransferase [Chitinophaga costaii]SCC19846.1 phosphoenolpyruvate--protein phosphotransferase [Chitinophaga costaii]
MKGIGVSPGIAIGKARVLRKQEAAVTGILLKTDAETQEAIHQFDQAVKDAMAEVEGLKNMPHKTLLQAELDLLDTQLELLSDPQIRSDVVEKITRERLNAHDAILLVIRDVVQMFRSLKDEYMNARSADMEDIGQRLLAQLRQGTHKAPLAFAPNTILIAEDIAPSDTIAIDTRHVIGFATQTGGQTSHAAIIAKTRGLPAVVGCGQALEQVKDNDIVIVDGAKGQVLCNPDTTTISDYILQREAQVQQQQQLLSLKDLPCRTLDGTDITLLGNISGAADLEGVFDHFGMGAGLLRTEMLFMGRNNFPTEEEQFQFYKAAALQAMGKPVTIRTIDIGGDKQLPYYALPVEQNPFLGYRAIRLCLGEWKDIFRTQLRAILRASAFGQLKVMFPMIANLQELRDAKSILEAEKQALKMEGIPYNAHMAAGIMIEVPSAAVMADMLAKECDFFSIGTNDLCQYTLAADRMNEKVAYLYDPYNPGVLRLIANVIAQGRRHHIPVSLCGELAADPTATLLLLGMGLRQFSMSAASIPAIKHIILQRSVEEAENIYEQVMQMGTTQDITQYLQAVTP